MYHLLVYENVASILHCILSFFLQVNIVDDFVSTVNNEVAVKQKMEKLQEVHKKISPYDCVETPGEEYNQFASKYSGFKIKAVMRHNQEPRAIVMEGHLKMKEGQTRVSSFEPWRGLNLGCTELNNRTMLDECAP